MYFSNGPAQIITAAAQLMTAPAQTQPYLQNMRVKSNLRVLTVSTQLIAIADWPCLFKALVKKTWAWFFSLLWAQNCLSWAQNGLWQAHGSLWRALSVFGRAKAPLKRPSWLLKCSTCPLEGQRWPLEGWKVQMTFCGLKNDSPARSSGPKFAFRVTNQEGRNFGRNFGFRHPGESFDLSKASFNLFGSFWGHLGSF